MSEYSYDSDFKEWLRNSIEFNQTEEQTTNDTFQIFFNNLLEKINLENDREHFQSRLIKSSTVLFFYSLIIFVSLFGNLLVCYIILSKQRLRSRTTNILILNLTVSDLLLTLFNIPLTTARILLDDWPFGSLLCKLSPFIQVISVYVSTISMTIIAIDRYQVLVGIFRTRFTTTLPTRVLIIIIWFLAGILSIPHSIFNKVVELTIIRKLIRCRAVYPTPESFYRQLITVLTFSTQYAIPLLIITICYTRIGIVIWRRGGIGHVTQRQRVEQNQLKWKTINMLILVVVVFAICWLPLNIHHIRTDFNIGNYSSDSFLIYHWIAMSSVCYNPFIYFWLNDDYRESAKYLLKYCFTFKCCRREQTELFAVYLRGEQNTSTLPRSNSNDEPNNKTRVLKRSDIIKSTRAQDTFLCHTDSIQVNTNTSPL